LINYRSLCSYWWNEYRRLHEAYQGDIPPK
jgi:hypothetical protein